MLFELEVLDKKQIELIDKSSMDILIEIGVKIPNEKILNILYDYGAKINKNNSVARFNEDIISKGIKGINRSYSLYGRDLNNIANFSEGYSNFLSTAGQYAIVDVLKSERRNPKFKDLISGIRLAELLDNIDIVGAFVIPKDIEVEKRDIISAYHLLKNTKKPIAFWINTGNSAKKIISMFEVIRGSKESLKKYPFCYAFIETISPLQYTSDSLDVLYEFANSCLPLGFGPMAMTFATAPGTLAGTLAIENAEILSGIIIARLINENVPVCYWGIQHTLDMQTGNISFGSPEQILMALASIQLGKYYKVAVGTNTGISDAICPDSQSGVERGVTASLALLAGCNIFGHQGIVGADQGASLIQLCIDNETIGYIKRIKRGFEVNDNTISFDEIKQVGIGGNFLVANSTLKNFRKEVWFPELFMRNNWEAWEKERKGIAEKALERVEEKLEKFRGIEDQYRLENNIEEELKKIMKSFG